MRTRAHVRKGWPRIGRAVAILALGTIAVGSLATPALADSRRRERVRVDRRARIEHRHVDRHTWHPHYPRSYAVERNWVAPRYTVPRYFEPPRTRVITWRHRPYQWHVNLGVYIPEFWFGVAIGDLPPAGYVYYDPYCDLQFGTLVMYREHVRVHRHPVLVDLVLVDRGYGAGYGPGWVGYEPEWIAGGYGACGWDD